MMQKHSTFIRCISQYEELIHYAKDDVNELFTFSQYMGKYSNICVDFITNYCSFLYCI